MLNVPCTGLFELHEDGIDFDFKSDWSWLLFTVLITIGDKLLKFISLIHEPGMNRLVSLG
jgi:hypothetical protein